MDIAILKLVPLFNGYGLALYIFITMAISGILALVIGFEREIEGEPAGLSTHILISISCSLLMSISIWAIKIAEGNMDFSDQNGPLSNINYDTSRIAAAVITGVGFIAAGAIIKKGFNVRGLSTAATLWISSAIGLACGAGFILEAIITTIVTTLILYLFSKVKNSVEKKTPSLIVEYKNDYPIIAKINELSLHNGMVIVDILSKEYKEETKVMVVCYTFKTNRIMLEDIKNSLMIDSNVVSAEIINTK